LSFFIKEEKRDKKEKRETAGRKRKRRGRLFGQDENVDEPVELS
jgi:hypothetical protein